MPTIDEQIAQSLRDSQLSGELQSAKGWGQPLDARPLLGSGHEFQMSSISGANAELHAELVKAVDAGVARLAALQA